MSELTADNILNGLVLVVIILIIGMCFFFAGMHVQRVRQEIKDTQRKSRNVDLTTHQ